MNETIFQKPVVAIFFCWLMLQLPAQLCQAQPTDSLLQNSRLYKKGKRNTTAGTIFLSIGALGSIVALGIKDKTPTSSSSGWLPVTNIGPSNKEVAFFISGIFGTLGVFNLIRGAVRKEKARSQLGLSNVSYWRAPGQQAQMPALTWRLTLDPAEAR